MTMFIANVSAVAVFAIAAIVGGIWLRLSPSREHAESSSRIMHLLFFVCLNLMPVLLFISPGISRLDAAVGVDPLSPRYPLAIIGVVLTTPGLYLLVVTNKLLRARGEGANAFRLTRLVVAADVYETTRNPMSLGFYLWTLGVAFVTGSTAFTALIALGVIPSHLLFLKWFEERELPLRLGPGYEAYKRRTPFLLPNRLPRATATNS